MQMVLYIWTYLRLAEKENWFSGYQQENGSLDTAPSLNLILPTGAMGNIVAGFMMQRMGLPIATFVAAVNINDITHQAFTTGAFHRSNNSETPMHRTLSEAINIQVPYNFERLLYYLTDCNDALVKSWYDGLAATGRIDLDDVWLTKLQSTFRSARVTDEQMCQAAARVYADYQYLADPHTAVAFSAAYQLGYLPSPPQTNASTGDNMASNTATNPVATKMASATVLLATASPCKFEEAVTAAVGKDVWMQYCESDQFPAAARHMLSLPEQTPLTIYPRKEGRTLKETQQEWEALARDVVRRMEQA